MTQKMAVAAIVRLFKDFSILEALQLVSDGIDRNRFPDYIREDMKVVRGELARVLDQPFEFLVQRVVDDIQEILEVYLDQEAVLMLEGLYQNAERIDEAENTTYHTLEILRDLG